MTYAELTDEQLEAEIAVLVERIACETEDARRRGLVHELNAKSRQRSLAQVARMEQKRGLT